MIELVPQIILYVMPIKDFFFNEKVAVRSVIIRSDILIHKQVYYTAACMYHPGYAWRDHVCLQ